MSSSLSPDSHHDRPAISDAELLASHHAGDPDAFSVLFWRYRNLLKASAVEVLRNGHDADDAVQDAMIRALRYIHTLRDPAKLPGWLKVLTVRSAIDQLVRSRTLERNTTSTDPASLVDASRSQAVDPYAAVDLALVLPYVLDQIGPDLAATWSLVVLCGRSHAEVADELGIAVGTVKSRVARSRAKIAATLRETIYGTDQPQQARPPACPTSEGPDERRAPRSSRRPR